MAPVRAHTIIDSPLGPITLGARNGVLGSVRFEEQRWSPAPDALGPFQPEVLPEARAQLAAYFAGELTEFDLPLRMEGTAFQHQVWAELRTIPYGQTTTYGELAQRLGSPTASRAVGAANGRNPIGVIVPCHRVIGAGGSLVGYGGGLDRKHALLALEGAILV